MAPWLLAIGLGLLLPTSSAGLCTNLPGANGSSWFDGVFTCSDYHAHPEWCDVYGSVDAGGHGSAQVACCGCGGGSSCADRPGNSSMDLWSDGARGCDIYAERPSMCDVFGGIDFGEGPAQWACCACGGGEPATPTPAQGLGPSLSLSSSPLPSPSSTPSPSPSWSPSPSLSPSPSPWLCPSPSPSPVQAPTPAPTACVSGTSVSLHTGSYGDEVHWSITTIDNQIECEGGKDHSYKSHYQHVTACCLANGSYKVTCEDRDGDGWNGGYLNISGQKFCEGFIDGCVHDVEFFESSWCDDSIHDWADKDGYRCADYGAREWCSSTGGYGPQWNQQRGDFVAVNGLTALDACCECGGGVSKCTSSIGGWRDKFKHTCKDYKNKKFCTVGGKEGRGWPPRQAKLDDTIASLSVNSVSANDACCECGGGWKHPPANSTCQDTNKDAKGKLDVDGQKGKHDVDCHWFTLGMGECREAWRHNDDDDFTAADMCCACSEFRCSPPPYVCDDGFTAPNTSDCDLKAIFRSPREGSGNRIHTFISWVLMGLDDFDEAAGTITVHADIQIWWRDCRLAMISERNGKYRFGCTDYNLVNQTLRSLHGGIQMLNLFGNVLAGQLQRSSREVDCPEYEVKNVWHPIPEILLPLTSENPRSRINKANLFESVHELSPGLWSATLVDSSKVEFDVTLNYAHFPFDQQTVHLEVPLSSECQGHLVGVLEGLEGVEGMKPLAEIISARSRVNYVASAVSPHVAQKLIDKFDEKGWEVDGASLNVVRYGANDHVIFTLKLKRKWGMVLMRFFIPLGLLSVVPFAGFYLPVGQVMPRVATGFVSFLTLTVFRNMAYSLIPKKTSSLLWMDVVMTMLTEIIWLAVIQNVVAQAMMAAFASTAARNVDAQARTLFPLICGVELGLLFILGTYQVRTVYTLWATQALVFIWIVFTAGRLWWFVRKLDVYLVTVLAKDMMSDRSKWYEGTALDQHEIDRIFRYIDKTRGDGSGYISAEELLTVLKYHGFRFTPGREEDEEEIFFILFRDSADASREEMGLDEFRERCKKILGGHGLRRVHWMLKERTEKSAAEELQADPNVVP